MKIQIDYHRNTLILLLDETLEVKSIAYFLKLIKSTFQIHFLQISIFYEYDCKYHHQCIIEN